MIINLRRGVISTFPPSIHFSDSQDNHFLPFPPNTSYPIFTLNDFTWLRKMKQSEWKSPTPATTSTYLITVDWCLLKPGLQASSISTTGELVRNANYWIPLQTYWIKFWGLGPAICAWVSAPSLCFFTLRYEVGEISETPPDLLMSLQSDDWLCWCPRQEGVRQGGRPGVWYHHCLCPAGFLTLFLSLPTSEMKT